MHFWCSWLRKKRLFVFKPSFFPNNCYWLLGNPQTSPIGTEPSTTQTSTERKTTPNCFENNATSQRNCIHGFSTPIGAEPSTTQISTERKTTPNRFENNATSQRNGIQGFFMFLSSLLLCLSVPRWSQKNMDGQFMKWMIFFTSVTKLICLVHRKV